MLAESGPPRAPVRRARVLAVVGVALVVGCLVLVAAQNLRGPATRDSIVGPAASLSSEPTEPPATTPTGSSAPIGTPSGTPGDTTIPGEGTSTEADPEPIPVRATAPVGGIADAGSGISISVPFVEAITARGEGGVGDLAGPAIAVPVRVMSGDDPLALNEVVVTATYGPARIPAPPNVSDPRSDPLSGPLKPGSSASGIYVFSTPGAGREGVTILVSYAGGKPSVAFTGQAG